MSETSNIVTRLLIIKIISEIKQTDARNIQVNKKRLLSTSGKTKGCVKRHKLKFNMNIYDPIRPSHLLHIG